ncbi:DNA-processing protein DprA [Leifsonia soli]
MSGACDGCAVAGLARADAQRDEPDAEGVVAEGPDAVSPDPENGPARCEETAAATGRESDGGDPSRTVPPSPSEGRRARTVLPGLSDTEVVRLVTAVSGGAPGGGACSSDAAVERFARAALTTAVEPGDLEAGRLVAALGPEGVLRAVVEGHDAERVLRAARHAEVVPLRGAPRAAFEDASPERAAEDARAVRRIAECLERWRPRLSLDESCRAVERASRLGVQLLTPDSDAWPEGFASLEGGEPLALWIRGDPNRLARLEHSVALVGARASTDYGEHVAMEAAAGLVGRGFAVVSGGAYGIDAAAHRATLASGGLTVAFLAGGVDRLYPAGNSDLLRRIAGEGVLAAELPPGNAPTRWRFLMRNRLIAAAASATVVVEAGRRSGSLNTAGHAAQLGRPLGAVPGSILSPASAGCHRLIREYAAICVTSAEEMAELADPLGTGPTGSPAAAAVRPVEGEPRGGDAEGVVLSVLSSARRADADEIAARAALPFTTVAAILGRLDLAGRARESGGGWTLSERRHA